MIWWIKNFATAKLALLAVLILAAGLRLFALDQIDVRYDEAAAPIFAHEVAHGILHPVVPFSGSVARHPAVWIYVLALPYLFTANFYVIAAYRVMLDVLAVALTGWLGWRYFNRRVGLFATLLFATAPWAVHLSRKLWTAPLALWSVLALIGLLEVAQRRNPKGWLLALWGLSLAVGTHLAALYLLPLALFVAMAFWRTLRWRWLAMGLLPALLIAAAYGYYDQQHSFANLRAMLGPSAQPSVLGLSAFRFALWLSGGTHLSDLTGSAILQWQWQNAWALEWIDELQMAWLLLALFAAIFAGAKAIVPRWQAGEINGVMQRRVGLGILALWWLLPVLAHVRHVEPFQVHYISPLYPAPFLLMACFADQLWRSLAQWGRAFRWAWRGAIMLFMLSVCAWQLFTVWRFGNFVAQHETSGYRPIAPALRAAQAVASVAQQRGGEVIVLVPNADPAVNEEAAILHFALLGQPHRFSDASAGLIVCPQNHCQYLIGPGGAQASDYLTPQALSQTRLDPRYGVATLNLAQVFPVPLQPIPNAPLGANGVQFTAYAIQRQPDKLRVWHWLTVMNAPPPRQDYHWYNHVLNAAGQKVAQRDSGGVAPANWQLGDQLLHWFDIPLTAEQSRQTDSLRIGSYEYPKIKPVMLKFADGSEQDGVMLNIR
ncbi:MAG: hypothetical protein KIH69_023040 [Anaerolineae bacterium]|nr:hypothetical protein [Anaerolineae bacterium]